MSCWSSEARSILSSDEKRCSIMVPELNLRIFTCTNPRRLPGVRCSILKIEKSSPFHLTTMPGRSCVAEIIWGTFSVAGLWLMRKTLHLAHALRQRPQKRFAPTHRGVGSHTLIGLLIRLREKSHRGVLRGQEFLDGDGEFHFPVLLLPDHRKMMHLG